jgi:hypothetical protein
MEISKRDYFAAQALTGLLARPAAPNDGLDVHANIAAEAFLYADEMLKLSKTLLDPIEIDPNAIANHDQPLLKEKSDTTRPPKSH